VDYITNVFLFNTLETIMKPKNITVRQVPFLNAGIRHIINIKCLVYEKSTGQIQDCNLLKSGIKDQ